MERPLPDTSSTIGRGAPPHVQIVPLSRLQTDQATGVLARAYVSNPLHEAAFGAASLGTNESFFRIGLHAMKGRKLAAVDGPGVLGVVHWARYPDCRFSPLEKLRMTPALVQGLGVREALRLRSWLSTWEAHHWAEPHVHLGPIAVEPRAQGRHIGSMFMEAYCEDVDRSRLPGFLETDRRSNIGFYERFGFEVTGTASVLGVENWFMRRNARA